MRNIFAGMFGKDSSPWGDRVPVRGELFGVERLEQHAQTLAKAQKVSANPPTVQSLRQRLNENASVLLTAYRDSAAELEKGRAVMPAAEWLLDNYHLVEAQIREIREDLPPSFYRLLPKLAAGPFAGYPRVFGLAWAFIAHTDSHFDPENLKRFINAYQRVQPLTIGELWAVAITLRIVLIENLRRLADQMTEGRSVRHEADVIANRLLVKGNAQAAMDVARLSRHAKPLNEQFAAQLAKRLRNLDPLTTPALTWLEESLNQQDSSIELIVQNAQQRLGASNVTVRNVITSMRLISDIDWATLFESVSLVDERLRQYSAFAEMNFTTRNLYRSAIEQLARGSALSELDIAGRVLSIAQEAAAEQTDPREAARMGDPGYHLIAKGRGALERAIGFTPPWHLRINRVVIRPGIVGYAGMIIVFSLLLAAWAAAILHSQLPIVGALGVFILLALPVFSDAASAVVNRMINWRLGASPLPGLALTDGVPSSLRTMIVVPVLLTDHQDIIEQIERLEVHYLASGKGDITFALLSDNLDAYQETLPGDAALLDFAQDGIALLNQRYCSGPAGARFLLLHRQRRFNSQEGCWMGWERKRGKLHELNRLLRGAADTSFIAGSQVPSGVRYVITLDADTRLPRDTPVRLVGKMAHPLNQPKYDAQHKRIISGYGILQPRVTASLPLGGEGSIYQRVFSGPGGIDPYAAAVSDVYQDLFGEGSYTGKGIYDVDAFEAALDQRIPDNTLLSHDLFEGIYARAGLASDVELVENAPARYDVVSKRQHRWTRGDWQLLPWIISGRSGECPVPAVGRWKMIDNLRRSLVAPFSLLALGWIWLLPSPLPAVGMLLIIAAMAVPSLVPIVCDLLPRRRRIPLGKHLRNVLVDFRYALLRIGLQVVFLADNAWHMMDAIGRTLFRISVSHRRLLEWTTSAQTGVSPRLTLCGFYRRMVGGIVLGLVIAGAAVLLAPWNAPLAGLFALLWLLSPVVAVWVSRPPRIAPQTVLSPQEIQTLRLIARRTWRFFETFVTPAENMLPPDNFQEDPRPVVAHRTSPTNIGLYLLSTVASRDFGWAGSIDSLSRLEATLASLDKLQRYRGHFFNWYETRNLEALLPAYVSSVDSGNLAGHLIALANACEEWCENPVTTAWRAGTLDHLILIRQALKKTRDEHQIPLDIMLSEIERLVKQPLADESPLPRLAEIAEEAYGLLADRVMSEHAYDLNEDQVIDEHNVADPDLLFWLAALHHGLAGHNEDRLRSSAATQQLARRFQSLADRARALAMAMDFRFLVDEERKLLSIGYSFSDNQLDSGCYDLLASEARLASLFAIAKGDIPTRYWFRLSRAAIQSSKGAALISWSGSMFEYLMPSLVMRAAAGTLLEQTNRVVVAHQQAYGHSLGIPWGVSESAYNARDLEFTYQYSNFGVPGLGLQRGLAQNRVIAPYATALASMVDGRAAVHNLQRLAEIGASGTYGFYEALDYTASRLPANQKVAIVRSYMAHHQGMSIVALDNTLLQGRMRARFHREPMIQASELLLQERMPREVALSKPHAEEVKKTMVKAGHTFTTQRRFSALPAGAPVTHLVSNGHYAVMLTVSGGGYSRWGNIAITRWREDVTCDESRGFIRLRDLRSGKIWSPGLQQHGITSQSERRIRALKGKSYNQVIFSEDDATYIHHDRTLTTTMNVLVSGEDDGEVRRVMLTNSGRRTREVELTSYAEIVLAPHSTDVAHPAFAKMFVQTRYLSEFSALIATRRPRTVDEPRVWAAHLAVVEGESLGDTQYETDRARFIGYNTSATLGDAVINRDPLSNTVGTVLDPIFSLRRKVRIPSGASVRVTFWTLVATTETALMALIDKHHDRGAYKRAKTLAWTQAQVQLRHLDINTEEAADFQRLAAPLLYADARFRAPSAAIISGAGAQSALWPLSISGDFPIVLLRIDDIQDIAQVKQLLRAHEYWHMKLLSVDLVIINEHASSYLQDLQIAIETAVRSSQSHPRYSGNANRGSVYTLRADLMTQEARMLLQSVARVSLLARRGTISTQLAALELPPVTLLPQRKLRLPSPPAVVLPIPVGLAFYNGTGGFANNGREYVVIMDKQTQPPAPWINVIANEDFGFQVSARGSGYTWAQNSRENQLTPWLNDPVLDSGGEAIYIRNEDNGTLWSPTVHPINDGGRYLARHGFGYSHFEHHTLDCATDLLQYVPLEDSVKISRLRLRNLGDRPLHLSVSAYVEWVLGTSRSASGPYIVSEQDAQTNAVFVRNTWATSFQGRVAFADLNGAQDCYTGDRTEFLGRNGSLNAPAALLSGSHLSGASGAGFDPCTVLQTHIEIAANQTVEVIWFIGQGDSAQSAQQLIEKYRRADLDAVLTQVKDHWQRRLGAVQVTTPDPAMDIMLNGWLLYQTQACRIQARSGFYQASGAYGFRDQLQDGMALTFSQPEQTRGHLLRAGGRQFPEGDVQHWWLPHSGQGVRTRISDDRVWLSFAVATYIACSHDETVLDEVLPYLEGPGLAEGEYDAFFQPLVSGESATLYQHCVGGIEQCLTLTGAHGLPLMGTGDWNDGMNRVGEGGKGESVWLGWLLIRTLALFSPWVATREPERAVRWQAHAESVRQAIERDAWDGDWYRRATFDDGSWLGSHENDECQIDSIAQSWAVLSESAEPQRAATAMASVDRLLIRHKEQLALLFTPPFDNTPRDPGYIKGYPPGLRENGGQYTHAAMWAILAFVGLGQGDKAHELFALLNPVNHALTPEQVKRYKVEPYVIAADVYSVAPHIGRGGWTWYTGSAGWMYRAGIEGILGIRREGKTLIVAPCIPADWPGFDAQVQVLDTHYSIKVTQRSGPKHAEIEALLDDQPLTLVAQQAHAPLDGGTHHLLVKM
ncbi:glucoamylase family protein [Acerihabitans sp. TG2]|uniref:GH36-type glycosyl hydrolase domain-containing protein n=1 Tax=Acerihabitans sp. TG2 TaxID=3096008 RepID=UPI002B22AACB|nr:glucoamylase family protein [Acerihabitans sp. TG2]MEA9392954.1 glucoamylase family protein [Acerihabitans sp. TG2]